MQSTQNEEMYKRMTLTIPDLVLPRDIPTIINWFDYYGIADVMNVDVLPHPEPEYNVEDRPFYGYAVIEIRQWYKNNSSKNFYNNLMLGCAAIIYDDPKYWQIQFYEPTPSEAHNIVDNLETNNSHPSINEDEARWEYDGPGYADIFGNRNDEDYFSYGEEDPVWLQEIKQKIKSEKDVPKEDIPKEDIPNHEDYEYKEIDEEEEDLMYEYVAPKNHKMETRSKRKSKEDKSKVTSHAVNTETITLENLIVRKNKNYAKRDKRKPFKNEWSRRLRRKLEV